MKDATKERITIGGILFSIPRPFFTAICKNISLQTASEAYGTSLAGRIERSFLSAPTLL
ncbi:hypothetical protein NBG4_40060 [Candidatus Sulfobium mesophilum]|uniref:Uncharacterized protein n=1 Tax=Candidatus Sulfobium mesophilum TaxID=2016548 RepID=A0A2U3QI29_9BACT|nr:hypothetical protein NBG4_40060 [Candidatus Sulfobium mesophilum]